jgi:hypothetical protein
VNKEHSLSYITDEYGSIHQNNHAGKLLYLESKPLKECFEVAFNETKSKSLAELTMNQIQNLLFYDLNPLYETLMYKGG